MAKFDTFEDLLNSDDTDIKDLAERAKKLKLRLLNNELTESEFEELFDNLKRLDYIEDKTDNFLTLKKIKTVIEVIDTIRHWAPM